MIGKYTGFIGENCAPQGVTSISIYDSEGEKRASMGLPLFMRYPDGKKLYSFGLLSDLHIDGVNSLPSDKLDNALSFFENEGAAFCAHTGDITNVGFWRSSEDTQIYTLQFEEYKKICGWHPKLPVYGICGNHDSYNKPITENLSQLEAYTGNGLYYAVYHGDDVFVFLGQPAGTVPMSKDALQWLYETLEANRNKRCFVFVHSFLSNDSGNAFGVYQNKLFDWWEHTEVFKSLLCHYKNTVLFHGHSHLIYNYQEQEKDANLTSKSGFRSVHVSSVCNPCEIINGVRTVSEDYTSLGYLVDVFDDKVVLRGRDFNKSLWLPIATYKLDTPLQGIAANTFTDDSGTIIT